MLDQSCRKSYVVIRVEEFMLDQLENVSCTYELKSLC